MNSLAIRNDNAPANASGAIMESVIIKGDLSKLTPQERSEYYVRVCQSIGLNPLTQPFQYITLNGKLTLYARRDAADQLRKINDISIEIVSKSVDDGLLTVHVRARDSRGRTDEDFGVVSVSNLKGEAAANAFLKAVTKAKRRVTLSLSGLGFLDETEVDDIPASAKTPAPPLAPPKPVEAPMNPETGELSPHKIEWTGNPIDWGSRYIAAVKSSQVASDIAEWQEFNRDTLAEIENSAPKAYRSIQGATAVKLKELSEAEDEPANLLSAG